MLNDINDPVERRYYREQELKQVSKKWFLATTVIFFVVELAVLYIFSGFLGFLLSFITNFTILTAIVLLIVHVAITCLTIRFFLLGNWFLDAVSSTNANADNQWGKVFICLGIITGVYLAITLGFSAKLLWLSWMLNIILVICLSKMTMNYDRRNNDTSTDDNLFFRS